MIAGGNFSEQRLLEQIARYQNLTEVIDQACRHYGQAPAVSNMGGTLNYAELARLSQQFAAYLQHATGLKPGDRIALMLPNLLQYPVAVFGALKAGLVVVTINPLFGEDELRQQLQNAEAKAILVLANSARLLQHVLPDTRIETVIITELGDLHPWPRRRLINARARYLRKIVPAYDIPGAVDFRRCLQQGAEYDFRAVALSAQDTALLQYTSGASGKAKGVLLSHRNLIANLYQVRSLLAGHCQPGREVVVVPMPLYHIYAFTLNLLVMLELGSHLVLITNPRDTRGFVRALARCKFTVISGINTLFLSLCRCPEFRQLDFSHLKLTIAGGSQLTHSVAQEWQAVTGSHIVEGYGLTEAAPVVAVNRPDRAVVGTVGEVLPLTRIRLVDELGVPLHQGEIGELWVRGPQLFRGYLHGERALTEDGWFATGDMARLREDGLLEIVDRKEDTIHTCSFAVYPGELENVISSHPDVRECAVIGMPDERSGEVIKLLVVADNPRLTVKQVRDYCRERLTSYKVPQQLEFRAALPKSDVGKVLRRQLREEELRKQQKLRRHL